MQFAGKKGYWTLLAIGVLLLVFTGWRYIDSFATVTFHYDTKQGSVQLAQPEADNQTVPNNQPVRLKKGEYTLTRHGKNVAKDSELITVDGSWQTRTVEFNFTREYLSELYTTEQSTIEAALTERYPKIKSLYTITGGALYGRGDYYGAALVFNDQKAPNRDRLHVLMQKEDDTWRVLSTPPTPVLSKQDYPTVDVSILRTINQVK